MLANAAVEYTYELKYLRPFDHLIILTNLYQVTSQHATKFSKGTGQNGVIAFQSFLHNYQ
jgi:hypothetical protein